MMARNATYLQRYTQAGETIDLETNIEVSGNGSGSIEIDVELTSEQTDVEVAIAFDKDLVKAFVVSSPVDLTIETNANDASGGNTIAVVAGEGYAWIAATGATNPFTNDVAKLFITNLDAVAVVAANPVKIRCLVDATP